MATPKVIYLDNNATTPMPKIVRDAICDAANLGNPSSEYTTERPQSYRILEDLRGAIAGALHVDQEVFQVVLTGSGSEANNLVLRATVSGYWQTWRKKPHIVCSSIEHKTSIDCLTQLRDRGTADVTFVSPEATGQISVERVQQAIRDDTALVTIMHANNETGAVNPIQAISRACRNRTPRIPFHTDAVQTFGKHRPNCAGFDAVTISFHKVHGPSGIGALVVRREFARAFHLQAEICGSQNEGLRGGTENVIGAAGALMGMQYTFQDRKQKNARMHQCRLTFLAELRRRSVDILTMEQFMVMHDDYSNERVSQPSKCLVVLTPLGEDEHGARSTPNTLLVAVVDYQTEICNTDIKHALGRSGIKISIGSACNTSATKASHVVGNLPAIIRRGTLRFSVGDETTPEDMLVVGRKFSKFCV